MSYLCLFVTLLLIISAKVPVAKLTHAWYDTKLLIQRNINLRSDDFQGWEPFANTMDTLRSLNSRVNISVNFGNL